MIKISGHSDDIICLEGDVNDEVYPNSDDEPTIVAFSDGTLLRVVYDNDGIWRITREAVGSAEYTKTEPEGEGYTDVVTLDGDIKWAVAGRKV